MPNISGTFLRVETAFSILFPHQHLREKFYLAKQALKT
jgi:hypothetical protein